MNKVIDGAVTVGFDIMENLVQPKSPTGRTYYSQQLYEYVFGVVVHLEVAAHSLNDVFLYEWAEHENWKDSNSAQPLLPGLHSRPAERCQCFWP